MIPATPTIKWFKEMDSLPAQFYWKNKKPRISFATLQNGKPHSGQENTNLFPLFLGKSMTIIIQMDPKAQLQKAMVIIISHG